MFVKGSVPGSKNSFVLIQKTSKKTNKKTTLEGIVKLEKVFSKTIATKANTQKPKNKETPPSQKDNKKIIEKKMDKK